MSERLKPCTQCNRHVFESETSCPFCGSKSHAARASVVMAVALTVGLAATACGGGQTAQPPANDTTQTMVTPPSGVTTAPPATGTAPAPSASAKPPKRGGDEPATIYGGPPPG